MSDEKIPIDLDPNKVLAAIEDMGREIKGLAAKLEESLGKDAPKSFKKFEDAAEGGTNKVSKYFRNLSQQIKEDMTTALAGATVGAGFKMGKDLLEGTKQVFEMERAFDRLNSRLKLTGATLADFKKELGRKVAATGQKLEDVLPGVETAAARGGVKEPKQLEQIAEVLGKVRATTGEGTEGIANTVVEIIKNEGQKVTADNFKRTLDALQGTRTAGAFKTAAEAGAAVNDLAPYAKKLGLTTRELGGLAAQASRAGPQGQDILRQLMEKGTSIGGQQQINAALGQEIFKNGKLDAGAFGRVDQNRFGKYSQQVMEQTTGLHGASGADLTRFLDSFKGGLTEMGKVVNGAEETADQFQIATDNLASKFDRFKEKTKEAGREIAGSMSKLGSDLFAGKFKELGKDSKKVGEDLWENKGTVAGGAVTALLGAALTGKAMRKLLSKVPGGGAIAGVAGAEAAKALGVQPVYVTNASEIGGGVGAPGAASSLLGGAGGKLAMLGGAAGAAIIGVEIGKAILEAFPRVGSKVGDMAFNALGNDDMRTHAAEYNQLEKGRDSFNQRNGTSLTHDEYAKAVETGTLAALKQAQKNKPTIYTNPSTLTGRGAHQ